MSKTKSVPTYKIGDTVYILANRGSGGTMCPPPGHPAEKGCSLHKCVVAQVDVGGVEGCYGLEWADTCVPVGLPFYHWSFCDATGERL